MNKVHSMLSESGLGVSFWAEAAATSVYLINRSPSSALDFKVPEELWTTQMPYLSNLKRFGCLAYVHSVEGKLEPRAKKGIFTGYPEGTKAYKFWLLDDEKVFISRNVIFREDKVYKGIKEEYGDQGNTVKEPQVISLKLLDVETDKGESQVSDGATVSNQNSSDTSEVQSAGAGEIASEDYQLARDRVRRTVKPPARLSDYECEVTDGENQFACFICLLSEDTSSEPNSYQEAMMAPDSDKWNEAALEEMTSLKANETWDLIDRPKD